MIKVKDIKPIFNQIVTTAHRYSREESMKNGIYVGKENTIKEYQTVLKIGSTVRDIKVGDVICINPARYVKLLHKEGLKDLDRNITKDDIHAVVDFPKETIYTKDADGVETSKEVLILYDNDVHYIAEIEEVSSVLVSSPSGIIIPS